MVAVNPPRVGADLVGWNKIGTYVDAWGLTSTNRSLPCLHCSRGVYSLKFCFLEDWNANEGIWEQ